MEYALSLRNQSVRVFLKILPSGARKRIIGSVAKDKDNTLVATQDAVTPGEEDAEINLVNESELKYNLYNWPKEKFSYKKNSSLAKYGTEPVISVVAGEVATDFTVRNACNDNELKLSVLLQYQAYKTEEAKLATKYSSVGLDRVHWVHVVSIEPHPSDSRNFDTGLYWKMYTSRPQAKTFEARLDYAKNHICKDFENSGALIVCDPLISSKSSDDEREQFKNNPLMTTYGPAPRCVHVIEQSGKVAISQRWFDARRLDVELSNMLGIDRSKM